MTLVEAPIEQRDVGYLAALREMNDEQLTDEYFHTCGMIHNHLEHTYSEVYMRWARLEFADLSRRWALYDVLEMNEVTL